MTTILVVDDDPDICSLLEYKLGSCGYSVIVEHDGEAALAAVAKTPVDLILLDWMMPRMGGLEACLALRADPRHARLPVLMLTAKAHEADVRKGLAAGADDYILKPFSPREVAARVAGALARAEVRPPPPAVETGRIT
jgi:DNA-binding response OmpR family regulator